MPAPVDEPERVTGVGTRFLDEANPAPHVDTHARINPTRPAQGKLIAEDHIGGEGTLQLAGTVAPIHAEGLDMLTRTIRHRIEQEVALRALRRLTPERDVNGVNAVDEQALPHKGKPARTDAPTRHRTGRQPTKARL